MLFWSTLLTLLLPVGGPVVQAGEQQAVVRNIESADQTTRTEPKLSVWDHFLNASEAPIAQQVRIERRVIMRISPRAGRARRDLTAELPQREMPVQLVERSMGDCIATGNIVGVSDRGSRLIMYMRDRSMVSATLEKACSPRDFYLGFYLERNEDGRLCVGRDRLMSRAGAKCHVRQMRKLEYVTVNE